MTRPAHPTGAADVPQIFESPGKVIIGLERLILETIGFDFRTRYPQKLLVKVVRSILGKSATGSRAFFATAYAMCIDLYKTFVPVKRTTLSMVMAVVELTARATRAADNSARGTGSQTDLVDRVRRFAARRRQHDRDAVVETMLDLLDLYVQHHKATKVGALFDLNTFIDIKIRLNKDLDATASPRYLFHCSRCEVADPNHLTPIAPGASPTATAAPAAWPPDASIRRTARGQDGTMRFVFDPEAADKEQAKAGEFFKDEYEEYEVEVEETVAPPPPYERDGAVGRGGGYRGSYRDRGDYRRGGGPYGGYRGDGRHHRGRGRYH